MFEYTGHPLVDVGIATILAFVGKDKSQELEETDLDKIADYMETNYFVPPLRGFLTQVFMNSAYTQYHFWNSPDKQATYAKKVLRSYKQETPTIEKRGVFMNLPIANVSFNVDDKLKHGRVFREHIPLQTGHGTINFHPYGNAGIPISGQALFAIQAYPLGSAKCEGRTLFVHSDNAEIMIYFAYKFLEKNRFDIQTTQLNNGKKMPEHPVKFRTLIVKTLIEALDIQQQSIEDEELFSITAFHLTSGKDVKLDIYHLPLQLIEYLAEMYTATYQAAWRQIERSAWVKFKPTRKQKEVPPDFKPSRNWLYEDLFNLAEDPYRNGRRFIRTYFLRDARHSIKQDKTDPRRQYSTLSEASLVSWKLTIPFLRRIMNMDPERIEHIRILGDRLAEYIQSEDDKPFFRQFYLARRYYNLSGLLSRRNREVCQRGEKPLLTLDTFLNIFEEGEGLARIDWQLARDLVLIRMVEQLFTNGWFKNNQDETLLTEEQSE